MKGVGEFQDSLLSNTRVYPVGGDVGRERGPAVHDWLVGESVVQDDIFVCIKKKQIEVDR